jgi:hypothetical protein
MKAIILRFPFIINFISMMKLENLKYTLVNKIKIAFDNIRKAIK